MVSLGHVAEEVVTGQVDIVNDLAQVGIEIGVSQVDQVVCKKIKDIFQPSTLPFLKNGPTSFMDGP